MVKKKGESEKYGFNNDNPIKDNSSDLVVTKTNNNNGERKFN